MVSGAGETVTNFARTAPFGAVVAQHRGPGCRAAKFQHAGTLKFLPAQLSESLKILECSHANTLPRSWSSQRGASAKAVLAARRLCDLRSRLHHHGRAGTPDCKTHRSRRRC